MKKTYISEITQRSTPAAAGLDDLADLVINNIPTATAASVTITGDGLTLVSDKYYGDAAGELHLDLRDLVRENTYLPAPGFSEESDEVITGAASVRVETRASIYLTVSVLTASGRRTWSFRAYPFSFFPSKLSSGYDYTPAADEIRVPRNFLLPFSAFDPDHAEGHSSIFEVEFISATKHESVLSPAIPGPQEAGIVSCLLTLSDLPFTPGEPFFLKRTWGAGGAVYSVTSPIYIPTMEDMEQYAFLNRFGIYENIPMSGALRDIPEFEIEVLQHSSGFEKVSGSSADLHEQNTGPISYQTAKALADCMLSNMAYYYDESRNNWRRIIIEAPTVDITRKSGVYNLVFTWRYADNDEIDNI